MFVRLRTCIFKTNALPTKFKLSEVKLQYNTKPLLMTEHGRVPVCLKDDDQHDPHCFHAHFLIFQSAEDIEELVASYFLERKVFYSLSDALAFATKCENYHLFSPHSKRICRFFRSFECPTSVFSAYDLTDGGPIGIIRLARSTQFAKDHPASPPRTE